MAHSKHKIWVHAIWSVKYREASIKPEVEAEIYDHIKAQFDKCKCPLNALGGVEDHVHALFLLHPDLSIRQAMKQIKGGSSHAINQSNILSNKFAWQVGASTFSVSESKVAVTRKYIQNQKEHHKKMSFEEEYQQFLKLYGLDKGDGE